MPLIDAVAIVFGILFDAYHLRRTGFCRYAVASIGPYAGGRAARQGNVHHALLNDGYVFRF